MKDIRIQTTLRSETLHLPELKQLVGKSIEVIVREVPAETLESFLGPYANEPVLDPEELEALRNDSKFSRFWPLLETVGKDIIDVEAIVRMRAASVV